MDLKNWGIARIRRTGLVALIMLVLSISLSACGDTAPAVTTQPTATPGVPTQAISTPVTASETPTSQAIGSDVSPTAVGTSTATAETPVQAGVCAKLNLNELTEDALLTTIPGFSSRMVREFLEYRPYASIQQFRREIGKYVDASTVAEYEKYVFVPVDPNASDADTLMQLPGVDATIAAALTEGRPYASDEAFLQSLATHVSEPQLADAHCYLGASQ
jgi:DNA uptake protein ComE-like DNA-binding protein